MTTDDARAELRFKLFRCLSTVQMSSPDAEGEAVIEREVSNILALYDTEKQKLLDAVAERVIQAPMVPTEHRVLLQYNQSVQHRLKTAQGKALDRLRGEFLPTSVKNTDGAEVVG